MKKILTAVVAAAFIGCFCAGDYSYAAGKKNSDEYSANVEKIKGSDYMSEASNKFMKGNIAGAVEDMNKAISVEPNSPVLYLNRGYLKHVSNDLAGAMDDYNAALKINPNYAYAYNNRGVLKTAMNDIQGAMDDYAKALSLNPKYSDVYYNRGNLKYMLSDNMGALTDFDTAIKLNPKDSEAYNNRGVVKKRLDLNAGALSDYSHAIALNPKDSIAYANRGRLKKLYFDNEGAAIDLDQAVALAETQTFIKNVKPLLSNEKYIAAIPVVNGITPDNPPIIQIPPKENEKLAENPAPKVNALTFSSVPKKDGTKLAYANVSQSPNIKKSSTMLSAGIGTVRSIQPPDIRTEKVTQAPTTNAKLAESYYIRGLQKCILRDLRGAVADLDKAIANNDKYADAYFYRAAIRKELGDIEGFRKDYAMAIDINPSLQSFNDSNAIGVVRG